LGSPPTVAGRRATAVIPIVFVAPTDPIGQGMVASLSHPGGNVTGPSGAPATTFQKDLELLAQLVPRLSRVAIVTDFSEPNLGSTTSRLQVVTSAANALGVQLKTLDVRSLDEVEPALAEALAWQAQAMLQFGAPGAVADAVPRLVAFQLQNRIPVAFNLKSQVQAGGLLSFNASPTGAGRSAALYVDRILKGAKPADLPVEQATVFELAVNEST